MSVDSIGDNVTHVVNDLCMNAESEDYHENINVYPHEYENIHNFNSNF